jgi:hypothetical protein
MHHSARGKSSLLAAFAFSLVLVAACRPAAEPGNEQQEALPRPTPKPVELPVPEPALDREALLIAALRAASAAATGVDDRDLQAGLRGRRFEFRWRFACPDAAKDAPMRAEYRARDETLRVTVEPTLDADSALLKPLLSQGYEAASGFIVDHPWLLTSACTPPSTPDGSLAIVELFHAEGSRAARPPEAYRLTERIEGGGVPEGGLDFVLSGRMEPLPDGKAISCLPGETGARPQCLISVKVDRAAVEDPATRETLAEWGAR